MGFLNLKNSIACLLLLQLSVTYANPMGSRTVEVSGKGFTSKTTVNLARITRNATTLKPDFQPEIKADVAPISRESAIPKNVDIIVEKQDESSAIQKPTEQSALTGNPDVSFPFWDSTKIENSQQTQEHSPTSEDEKSKSSPPKQENSSVDRNREAERLQKVVSVLHLNRVLGASASPPASRRSFNGPSEPFDRQRALGFPHLITNTLDNFHHQLDWTRLTAFL